MQQSQLKPVQPATTASGRRRRLLAGALCAAAGAGVLMAFQFGRAPVAQAAKAGAAADLAVHLTGVAGNAGQVLGALCDRDGFLKRCAHMVAMPAAPSMTLRFKHIVPGRYAVMLFHDENENGLFDKSPNGMPLEGYGFSRNARGKYGPPSFDDAAIELKPGAMSIDVELTY